MPSPVRDFLHAEASAMNAEFWPSIIKLSDLHNFVTEQDHHASWETAFLAYMDARTKFLASYGG